MAKENDDAGLLPGLPEGLKEIDEVNEYDPMDEDWQG